MRRSNRSISGRASKRRRLSAVLAQEIGRVCEFGFDSSLLHHDRWIARWARGVSLLELSSTTANRDRMSSCGYRARVWRILNPAPSRLYYRFLLRNHFGRSFHYSPDNLVVLVQLIRSQPRARIFISVTLKRDCKIIESSCFKLLSFFLY